MIKCPSCGARIADDADPCPRCGKRQAGSTASAAKLETQRLIFGIVVGLGVLTLFGYAGNWVKEQRMKRDPEYAEEEKYIAQISRQPTLLVKRVIIARDVVEGAPIDPRTYFEIGTTSIVFHLEYLGIRTNQAFELWLTTAGQTTSKCTSEKLEPNGNWWCRWPAVDPGNYEIWLFLKLANGVNHISLGKYKFFVR